MVDLNIPPYYEDYDEDKGFHRILYRPGFAVQARELTQQQTILQKQIERFGDYVFTKGSRVTGGQIFVDENVKFSKLESTYANTVIDVTNFDELYVEGANTAIKGRIIYTEPAGSGDESTIFFKVLENPAATTLFGGSEVLNITYANGSIAYTAQTIPSNPSGNTTFFGVDEGVFFIQDSFVKVSKQTIPVSKYDPTANVIIGFNLTDEFVTSLNDSSLLDPANGSPNKNAPGADRLKRTLTLTTIPFSNTSANNVSNTNFIEVARFENGKQIQQYPIIGYSELDKKLAKRTFDESGNYSVKKFVARPDIANNTHLSFKISPGLAYVNGFQIEKTAPTRLVANRATDTESITGFDVSSYYGNFIKITNLEGRLFDMNSQETVTLHNTASLGSITDSTYIGSANIRQIQYDSGTANNQIFNCYLFNIQMTGNNSFANTLSIAANTASNTFTSKAVVSNNTLGDTQYNSGVFKIPYPFVESVSSASYTTRKIFKSVAFTNGQGAITTGGANERFKGASGGDVPSGLLNDYYSVVVNTGSGSFSSGEFVPLDTDSRSVNIPVVGGGSPGTATIDLQDATFNGTADIFATIDVTSDTRRTKTLTANTKAFTSIAANTDYSLELPDVYKINGIYDSANVSAPATTSDLNVTSKFLFDNGQRDNYYDFASIRLKQGEPAPTGQVLVDFDFFTHGGGSGFFDVGSYSIDYADIPSFTSERSGELIQLRDALDFRPVRDSSNTATVAFNSHRYPIAFDVVDTDLSYYLSRKDRIVLKDNGNLEYLQGISNFTTPKYPNSPKNSMSIATIDLRPFGVTLTQKDVAIKQTDNRRYTMRDIGNIDRRVDRVEYYTSLSLLEKEIESRKILDSLGQDVFKNGIVVDSFSGHGVGDVKNRDYKVSIDTTKQVARPPFGFNELLLEVTSANTTANIGTNLVTIPYTEVEFINQPLASKAIQINPFNVDKWTGVLTLSPDNDTWFEYKDRPDIIVNNSGDMDSWESGENFEGAYFNVWENVWSGEEFSETETINRISSDVGRETADIRLKKTTDNVYNSIFSTNKEVDNDLIVNKDVVPYIRRKTIKWDVKGMRPNTEIHLFFDGVLMSGYAVQTNKTALEAIVTDSNGAANGYFYIPNSVNKGIRFSTGEKEVVFADTVFDYRVTTTKASAVYSATGIYKEPPAPIISTTYVPPVQTPSAYIDVDGQFFSGSNPLLPTEVSRVLSWSELEALHQEPGRTQAEAYQLYLNAVDPISGNPAELAESSQTIEEVRIEYAAESAAAGASDYDDLVSQIASEYQSVLGRKPDRNGLQYWVDEAVHRGSNLTTIKAAIANSPEAKAKQ